MRTEYVSLSQAIEIYEEFYIGDIKKLEGELIEERVIILYTDRFYKFYKLHPLWGIKNNTLNLYGKLHSPHVNSLEVFPDEVIDKIDFYGELDEYGIMDCLTDRVRKEYELGTFRRYFLPADGYGRGDLGYNRDYLCYKDTNKIVFDNLCIKSDELRESLILPNGFDEVKITSEEYNERIEKIDKDDL